jgi:hypothetical protein
MLFPNLGPLNVQFVLSSFLHSFPSFSTYSTWKARAAMLLLKRSVYFCKSRQNRVLATHVLLSSRKLTCTWKRKEISFFPALIHVCQIQRMEENFARLDPLTVFFPFRRQRLQQNTKTTYSSYYFHWTCIEFV